MEGIYHVQNIFTYSYLDPAVAVVAADQWSWCSKGWWLSGLNLKIHLVRVRAVEKESKRRNKERQKNK